MFEYFEPTVPQISANAVHAAISSKQKFVLLDVRSRGECDRGMIDGALNIPVDEVPSKVLRLVPDQSAQIYVYCFSGSRSVFAVEAMIQMGYKNVFNLTSGLLAWRSIGLNVNQK